MGLCLARRVTTLTTASPTVVTAVRCVPSLQIQAEASDRDKQLRIMTDQNAELLRLLEAEEAQLPCAPQTNQCFCPCGTSAAAALRAGGTRGGGRGGSAHTCTSHFLSRPLKLYVLASCDVLLELIDVSATATHRRRRRCVQAARAAADAAAAVRDLEALRGKYGTLLTTAKQHEEMAGRAAREGQLRAEEVRLLRAEVQQLRSGGADLRMKAQVELESLQEQLRVRKEKQYQLLEKLQGQEEAKRQAEDQVSSMEDRIRALHTRSVELDTQLQVEARGRAAAEDANKALQADGASAHQALRDLQSRLDQADAEVSARSPSDAAAAAAARRGRRCRVRGARCGSQALHAGACARRGGGRRAALPSQRQRACSAAIVTSARAAVATSMIVFIHRCRLRMEAEARDSGEQLREMAEKVFQLLERLKLAELAKGKAMEALRRKEQEEKKAARLLKESTKEGKARVKAELDLQGSTRAAVTCRARAHTCACAMRPLLLPPRHAQVALEQVSALKRHNAQLASRCRDEAKEKLREHDERTETQEKVRTLGGRLTFLLTKMQSDEEARIIHREEARKLEAQVKALMARAEELATKLDESGESNRVLSAALRAKQAELEQLAARHAALQRQTGRPASAAGGGGGGGSRDDDPEAHPETEGDGGGGGDVANDRCDPASVRASGGRGIFYVESKPTQGLMLARCRRESHRAWLDRCDLNGFLKRAQRSTRFKELAVERLCHVHALLLVEEEERAAAAAEGRARAPRSSRTSRARTATCWTACRARRTPSAARCSVVDVPYDAVRAELVQLTARYVHAVKSSSAARPADGAGAPGPEGAQPGANASGSSGSGGGGIIQLPESGVTDEERCAHHAPTSRCPRLAACILTLFVLLPPRRHRRRCCRRRRQVHAIAALLRGSTAIAELNLRGNAVTDEGARALAAVLAGKSALRVVDLRANAITAQGIRTLAEALERSERVRHVYVHAGGKVEALGTGLWAAPRNAAAAAAAAAAPAAAAAAAPLVTVETVCVVDVRDNRPPPGGARAADAAGLARALEDPGRPLPAGLLAAAASAPALSFATAALPCGGGGGGADGGRKEGGGRRRGGKKVAGGRRGERSLSPNGSPSKARGGRGGEAPPAAPAAVVVVPDNRAEWAGRRGGLETGPRDGGASPHASATTHKIALLLTPSPTYPPLASPPPAHTRVRPGSRDGALPEIQTRSASADGVPPQLRQHPFAQSAAELGGKALRRDRLISSSASK
ncbi:leucine rich repeat protein [Tribonema minus]|uniref:Leucine rich repeat protein n=1 Tax=Tribonema minus TaxID=303371 RepID=A0A836CDM1_9STRA|nr:leucine rich repeat protein [Tribonema minus]